MPSTVIGGVDYDRECKQLRITFTTGRVYIYENVPPDIVRALLSSGMRGVYLNRHIRGAYAYREVQE